MQKIERKKTSRYIGEIAQSAKYSKQSCNNSDFNTKMLC